MPVVNNLKTNLIFGKNLTPYCYGACTHLPRTVFNGEKFICLKCRWTPNYSSKFMKRYIISQKGNEILIKENI